MEELRRCKICGTKAENIHIMSTAGFYWAYCGRCLAETRVYKTKEECIEAWNRKNRPIEL